MTTSTITQVPLLDLEAHYAPIKSDILHAMERVFDSKQFIMGKDIEELEAAICKYTSSKFSLGVSSGTDALLLAFMALGIGHGDEVITTPFTFFATAGCISRVGATPVFVDIEPDTLLIDASKIEEKITSKTKCIVPVHLFGQMADMEAINAIAKKHNLFVVEDAAQAIGSGFTDSKGTYHHAGSMGDIGCFSFFPSKNLGCCGDGGIMTFNDPAIYEQARLMRVHGSKERYYHDVIGGNFRLDTIQAAVLLVKLAYLEDQHKARQANGAYYNEKLANSGFQLPGVKAGRRMIYNQYTLRCADRTKIMDALKAKNIGHAIYYPIPLHLQVCFSDLGYKAGDCPESEKAAKEVLSIPIYSELTHEQMDYIVEAVKASL